MGSRWIDLVDPTADELAAVLPPTADAEIVEGLAAPPTERRDTRPGIEGREGAALVVLAVPVSEPGLEEVSYLELDVLVTTERVVTVRKRDGEGRLAAPPALEAADDDRPPRALLHAVLDDVADRYLDFLDALYAAIDELEDGVDALAGPTVRRRVADLRHELLRARRATSATRAIVRRILDERVRLPDATPVGVDHGFVDTYETLVRVTEELDVARDLLSSVRDYYQAKVAEGQNEVGKKLTVVASLVLVPSLIVGFYGQNFQSAFDDAFWSIGVSVGLIVATTVVQLALFRWRRWI